MNNTLTGPVALLKSSWAFYRAHWKTLVSLVAVPYLAVLVGNVLSASGKDAGLLPLIIVGALLSIAGAVFMVVATSGTISAVDKLSKNPAEAVSFRAQYKIGLGLFWALVLVGIIRGVGSMGSFFLFVIPGIMFVVYTAFCAFALVVDGKHGISAFTESFAIVRGRWWKTLGRFVVLGLVYIVLFLIVAGLEYALGQVGRSVIVVNILNGILTLAFMPFALIYSYHLYVELRTTRREGDTTAFKRWLIAFMVIGVIGFVMLFLSIPLVALNQARIKAQSLQAGLTVPTGTDIPTNGNLVK